MNNYLTGRSNSLSGVMRFLRRLFNPIFSTSNQTIVNNRKGAIMDAKKINEHKRKLVSNARAIISNQIGLPLGALKMDKIISWINQIEPLAIDLTLFDNYYSEISHLSIGTERLSCSREFLRAQDKELDAITMHYKEEILDKCFEIVAEFGDA